MHPSFFIVHLNPAPQITAKQLLKTSRGKSPSYDPPHRGYGLRDPMPALGRLSAIRADMLGNDAIEFADTERFVQVGGGSGGQALFFVCGTRMP